MGRIAKYGSTIIVLINTLFFMIALIFLVLGILVKHFPEYVDKYGGKLLSLMKEKLPDQFKNYVEDIKISEFVGEAATAFIVVGAVLLGLVIWAYCGTCCKSRWMLMIYAAILTAIIVGEVTVAILFSTKRDMIDQKIKEPLKESLTKFYEGSASKSAISRLWNALMGLMKCCGVDGPQDFQNATGWDHILDRSSFTTPAVSTGGTTHGPVTLEAPIICAKDIEEAAKNAINHQKVTYVQTGCYAALWAIIEKNKNIAIGAAAGVGAFQLLLFILTICIIKDIWPKKKRNRVAPS